ncbi:uncharacterized protein LOC144716716 isoform X2 [Wolffia australiana]
MRKHGDYKCRRVLREFSDRDLEEIGSSRTFRPRGRPRSMPAVGTRSSTRVFVPKNISKVSPGGLRILRSGKRLTSPKIFERKAVGYADGDAKNPIILDQQDSKTWKEELPVDDYKDEKHNQEKIVLFSSRDADFEEYPENTPPKTVPKQNNGFLPQQEKSFGIFYSRKRRRPKSFDLDSPSSVSTVNEVSGGVSLLPDGSIPLTTEFGDFSGSRYGVVFVRKPRWKRLRLPASEARTHLRFGRTLRIPDRDPWFESAATTILLILQNPIARTSSDRVTRLILSLLTGIMKKDVSLFECAAFLSSGALPRVFSSQGIDFLPVRDWRNDSLLRSAAGDSGVCILFGARQSIPLVSIDFSSLPFFFTNFQFQMLGSSLRPSAALRFVELYVSVEERRLCSFKAREEEKNFEVPVNLQSSISAFRSPVTPSGIGSRLQKSQRKSFGNSSRGSRRSLSRYRRKRSMPRQNGILRRSTDSKVSLSDENVHKKRRKVGIKGSDFKSVTSTEVDQSVDFLCCTANVLVIESDRCWREEGASVALEPTSSNKWCIIVRSAKAARYIYKAQEVKLSYTNRYTHSMIWAGETGWKLEFFRKKDWIVFKELHKECLERNLQVVPVKVIPIPGVREVAGYEERFTSLFARPGSYIRTSGEVERAMKSKIPCYDADSGDEEWLGQLNSSHLGGGSDHFASASLDTFESIIFSLEKAAYDHPEGPELEHAVELCSDLASRDVIVSVFDYWTKKRKQRRSTLIKVFQALPQKKVPLTQSSLRKRRSFKKQGSHVGRGKRDVYVEGRKFHPLPPKWI